MTPTLAETLEARRAGIVAALKQYGVVEAWIVGVYDDGDDGADSVVDFAVRISPRPTGFAFFARFEDLQDALTAIVGVPVEVYDRDAPGGLRIVQDATPYALDDSTS